MHQPSRVDKNKRAEKEFSLAQQLSAIQARASEGQDGAWPAWLILPFTRIIAERKRKFNR